MRKSIVTGVVAGAILIGGAGAALVPTLASAADPSASPSASGSTSPTNPGANTPDGGPSGDRGFGPGGHGPNEAVSDASVVAKAIGITEADLNTALAGGQTVAAVAKAHSVDVQVVIDALVADKKTEVAADLKAGAITQAQADEELASATQLATDQVNGVMGGPGGLGGHGPGGYGPQGAPGASSGTSG